MELRTYKPVQWSVWQLSYHSSLETMPLPKSKQVGEIFTGVLLFILVSGPSYLHNYKPTNPYIYIYAFDWRAIKVQKGKGLLTPIESESENFPRKRRCFLNRFWTHWIVKAKAICFRFAFAWCAYILINYITIHSHNRRKEFHTIDQRIWTKEFTQNKEQTPTPPSPPVHPPLPWHITLSFTLLIEFSLNGRLGHLPNLSN